MEIILPSSLSFATIIYKPRHHLAVAYPPGWLTLSSGSGTSYIVVDGAVTGGVRGSELTEVNV